MVRSHTTCRVWPPPAAHPVTTPMTTLGMKRMRRCTSRMCRRPAAARLDGLGGLALGVLVARPCPGCAGRRRSRTPSPPSLGDGPLPVRSTQPTSLVMAGVVEGAVQLVDGVGAEGVAHLGPVEGDAHRAGVDGPVVGDVGQLAQLVDGRQADGSKVSEIIGRASRDGNGIQGSSGTGASGTAWRSSSVANCHCAECRRRTMRHTPASLTRSSS